DLARDLGWPGLALVALAPWLLARGNRAVRGVILYALGFALPPFLSRAAYARYLLPALPALAALAAAAASELAARVRLARAATLALGALLVLPVAWNGVRAAATGRDTTQAEARRFIEQRLG